MGNIALDPLILIPVAYRTPGLRSLTIMANFDDDCSVAALARGLWRARV